MESKRIYQAPTAQGFDVKIEKTILSTNSNSAMRESYGTVDEI